MSDEVNVTYVGGKAIEQSEAPESNLEADERSEAMEAVREAIKGAAKEAGESAEKASKQDPYKPPGAKADATPPKDPKTGKFLPKDKEPTTEVADSEPEEEEIDPSSAGLKQLLKAREKLAKQKANVKDELAQERAKIQAEAQKLQQGYAEIQRMQQEIQREQQKLQMLKKDPARAVREFGWEPEQFIVDLARDGTPEGVAARQQRELQEQLQEIKAWKQEMAQREQQARAWQEQQQLINYRGQIEQKFLGLAFDAEKNPHIAHYYKGREDALIAEGDLIAAKFRELSGGREGELEEIVDFIEGELADRSRSWYESKSGSKQAVVPPSEAGKKPAKGSKGKTLSPDLTSQRSTLNKRALKDLDEEERLAAAKESVGLALASAAER